MQKVKWRNNFRIRLAKQMSFKSIGNVGGVCYVFGQSVPCLSSSNLKCSTSNSGQIEWWHDQAISAGRAETTPTRWIWHTDEQTQLTRCSLWRTLYARTAISQHRTVYIAAGRFIYLLFESDHIDPYKSEQKKTTQSIYKLDLNKKR